MTTTEQKIESPWLITYEREHVTPVQLRLFCFHYAGATASIFRSWQMGVPAGVEVVAVQLPGRDYRLSEPLLADINRITVELRDVLRPLLDVPFAVFGHSMGALIAFDLIRLLRKDGLRQPELLIASGRNSPQFKWKDAGIEMLPDEAFITAVRDYNGIPEALAAEPALRDLWMPRLRSDLTISAIYQYEKQPALECPILVLCGTGDSLVSDVGAKAWLDETTGPVSHIHYPGNHFFLHTYEQRVLADISTALENHLPGDKSAQREDAGNIRDSREFTGEWQARVTSPRTDI